MSVNNQSRTARGSGRGNAGLSLVRNFLIMLILAALSFGFGFGVLANLIPNKHKTEDSIKPAAVSSTPQTAPAETAPAETASSSPAAASPKTQSGPVDPSVKSTTAAAPGPTLDPAPEEGNSSGESDVQKPRRVEGDTTPSPSASSENNTARSEKRAALRDRKKRHPKPTPETDSSSTGDSANAAETERPATGVKSRDPEETGAASVSKGLYRVQIGVYSTREAADREAQRAADKGFATSVQPYRKSGATYYRVQHGAYRDRAHADAAKESLGAAGFDSSVSNPSP